MFFTLASIISTTSNAIGIERIDEQELASEVEELVLLLV